MDADRPNLLFLLVAFRPLDSRVEATSLFGHGQQAGHNRPFLPPWHWTKLAGEWSYRSVVRTVISLLSVTGLGDSARGEMPRLPFEALLPPIEILCPKSGMANPGRTASSRPAGSLPPDSIAAGRHREPASRRSIRRGQNRSLHRIISATGRGYIDVRSEDVLLSTQRESPTRKDIPRAFSYRTASQQLCFNSALYFDSFLRFFSPLP